jgi:hypothetical protein
VGRHSRVIELRAQLKSAGGDVSGRHIRTPWSLPLFATLVTIAFVIITIVPPNGSSAAYATVAPGVTVQEAQTFTAAGEYTHSAPRDTFTTSEIYVPPPAPVVSQAPAAGVPDPGTAQAIAFQLVAERGWGQGEFDCLVALWNRESGWNVYAHNESSGAYGIPQALPGDKMSVVGADWATNPTTQILWGLAYIANGYGTPCGAWAMSESQGWY